MLHDHPPQLIFYNTVRDPSRLFLFGGINELTVKGNKLVNKLFMPCMKVKGLRLSVGVQLKAIS